MTASRTGTALSEDVLGVLRRGSLDGCAFTLPEGQLDRKLYVQVNEALEALGGKWSKKARAHVFSTPPDLDAMLSSGKAPPKNPDAFFPTPLRVVQHMVELAAFDGSEHGGTCLEPSAGEGAIALLVPAWYELHCVEINEQRARKLSDRGAPHVWHSDFLDWGESDGAYPRYDRIVMNPPFALAGDATAWMAHIRHALTMLHPKGVLVAVVPVGYTQRDDRKHSQFRASIASRSEYHSLPEDSFRESGTGVNCGLLVVHGSRALRCQGARQ